MPTNDQVPIENVVVAESGDDSDDEWNYIKVNKGQTKEEQGDEQKVTAENGEENKEYSKLVLEEFVASPIPLPAFIPEPDLIYQLDEETHPIVEACAADIEETCNEVN